MSRTTSSGEVACVLLVDDRIVLRASGPPEAEYALFESDEIELRASEPRRIREHGYRTTAALARSRLASLGMTTVLAREVAGTMQPVLADAYARGPAVRRVTRYLGATELLQPDHYDAEEKRYHGVFLDLAALARDVSLERVGATFQALYLSMLLDGLADDAPVVMSTSGCAEAQRPGARTYKRPRFTPVVDLLRALGTLAQSGPKPLIEPPLSPEEVAALLQAREEGASDDDARALYQSLQRAVTTREMPERGPLAAPDVWELETRIDAGALDGGVEALDEIERRTGRTPATTYLRARLSLAMGLEPAGVLAERMSALALSMTSFQELALLAAECWLEAGEPGRAIPYARDLVDAPGLDAGLLLRAQRVLARANEPAMAEAETGAAPPPLRSEPPATRRAESIALSTPPAEPLGPAVHREQHTRATIRRTTTQPGLAEVRPPLEVAPPTTDAAGPFALDLPGGKTPRPPRPTLRLSEVPQDMPRGRFEAPSREMAVAPELLKASLPSERPPRLPTLRPGFQGHSVPAPAPDPPLLHGASLPAYEETSGLSLPGDAELPELRGGEDALAEHLALPPELETMAPSVDELPRSALDARVAFTLLARELGRDYRVDRKIALRADLTGIEAMQAVLLERFHARPPQSREDAYELRRHGALLAEILARRLGAAWVDITASELGYWAMLVPPNTRVWPFGRIARLLAMAHRERDLVSYYLELEARASRR